METLSVNQNVNATSKSALWTGRIIKGISVLFLLVDAIMKIVRESHSVEGTIQLGWPDGAVQVIGVVLLISTVLYIIPRTSFFGALLLTGYLGGAISTMARLGINFYFPVIFAVLIWTGLLLLHTKLRAVILNKK
jgi:hypothetical protein